MRKTSMKSSLGNTMLTISFGLALVATSINAGAQSSTEPHAKQSAESPGKTKAEERAKLRAEAEAKAKTISK